jgi:RNA 3'-terminal phosphate cyclase (ATP)
MAPSFDFLTQTFLPLLHRMGASVRAELERPGFYPAGGGCFVVELVGGAPLGALELTDRGAIERVEARAVTSQIPGHVAEREIRVLAGQLADLPFAGQAAQVDSAGPGNVVTVTLRAAHLTETFTGFGERGLRAEQVAQRVAGQLRKYLAANAPVGEQLADQLLIPMALGAGGQFRTLEPSLHTRTNAEVIGLFLPGRVRLQQDADGGWTARVQ